VACVEDVHPSTRASRAHFLQLLLNLVKPFSRTHTHVRVFA
jgi:hypothetical protein